MSTEAKINTLLGCILVGLSAFLAGTSQADTIFQVGSMWLMLASYMGWKEKGN